MTTLTLRDNTTNKVFTKDIEELHSLRTFLIRIYHGNKISIIEYTCEYPWEYSECSYWYNRIENNRRK